MVEVGEFDGCKFGVRVRREGRKGEEHWRSEMKLVTNSWEVWEEMQGRCREEVRHVSSRGSGRK